MLEPTTIYVRAIMELLRSELTVKGLAHITGGGVLNLLRLGGSKLGFSIPEPLPASPVFGLIAAPGEVPPAEMWEVFNMGCGFVAIVPPEQAQARVGDPRRAPSRYSAHRNSDRRSRDRRDAVARPGWDRSRPGGRLGDDPRAVEVAERIGEGDRPKMGSFKVAQADLDVASVLREVVAQRQAVALECLGESERPVHLVPELQRHVGHDGPVPRPRPYRRGQRLRLPLPVAFRVTCGRTDRSYLALVVGSPR